MSATLAQHENNISSMSRCWLFPSHFNIFDQYCCCHRKCSPFTAQHEYHRFSPVLVADQIIDIETKLVFKYPHLQMCGLKLNI